MPFTTLGTHKNKRRGPLRQPPQLQPVAADDLSSPRRNSLLQTHFGRIGNSNRGNQTPPRQTQTSPQSRIVRNSPTRLGNSPSRGEVAAGQIVHVAIPSDVKIFKKFTKKDIDAFLAQHRKLNNQYDTPELISAPMIKLINTLLIQNNGKFDWKYTEPELATWLTWHYEILAARLLQILNLYDGTRGGVPSNSLKSAILALVLPRFKPLDVINFISDVMTLVDDTCQGFPNQTNDPDVAKTLLERLKIYGKTRFFLFWQNRCSRKNDLRPHHGFWQHENY